MAWKHKGVWMERWALVYWIQVVLQLARPESQSLRFQQGPKSNHKQNISGKISWTKKRTTRSCQVVSKLLIIRVLATRNSPTRSIKSLLNNNHSHWKLIRSIMSGKTDMMVNFKRIVTTKFLNITVFRKPYQVQVRSSKNNKRLKLMINFKKPNWLRSKT